jgi:DNA invertase Pin-like site-specific DNA recombinase
MTTVVPPSSRPATLSSPPDRITAAHLKRAAYLYVRQSTLRQVFENTESTQRQYALRQRAVALGWPLERIIVIDVDQGHSGARAADRAGFQRLVAEVGMGQAGIVMGLEVSRLARNSADWHRLLEICALTETLILDEDGLYDPGHFNDRLLLGLKGTMSEAELHVLRARLRGGLLNKARRGDLWLPPPVGLVYDGHGQVVLDPDQQVQGALRLLFAAFQRTGSACATVREFRRLGLQFPRRGCAGPQRGELLWGALDHARVLQVLHNPRYAGAFVYGRRRTRPRLDGGSTQRRQPQEEWAVLIPQAHPGYLTWDEYQANQQRLLDNGAARGADRRHGPPREGPALLQGLVICGRCGRRMTVRYHGRADRLLPEYLCQAVGIQRAEPLCQTVRGQQLDAAVGRLLVDTLTPVALEMALQVHDELVARSHEADRLRHQQVERARWEADLARRRYLSVDPDNRLVADSLEAEWNAKLRALTQAQEDYESRQPASAGAVPTPQRAEVLALAEDFPRLWQSPETPPRERKRLLRLLVEDVTLLRHETFIAAHVRFPGGTTTTLQVPLGRTSPRYGRVAPELLARIDQLLDEMPEAAMPAVLHAEGFCGPHGQPLDYAEVSRLRATRRLRGRYQRLRARGLLTGPEVARRLGVSAATLAARTRQGLLQGIPCDGQHKYLFDPTQVPNADVPPPVSRRYLPVTPQLLARLDALLDDLPAAAVADQLRAEGECTADGVPLDTAAVQHLRRVCGLRSRYQRLRARGLLTGPEAGHRLGIGPATLSRWTQRGRLRGIPCDGHHSYLYEPGEVEALLAPHRRSETPTDHRPAPSPSSPGGAV